jgi:hypothetical protein
MWGGQGTSDTSPSAKRSSLVHLTSALEVGDLGGEYVIQTGHNAHDVMASEGNAKQAGE